jgi:lipoprotein-anchoring transpeptidase ErfK/SrfK
MMFMTWVTAAAMAGSMQSHPPQKRHTPARKPAAKHAAPAFDEHALEMQVMLDRAGFSAGEIDGTMGTSTTRALDAFTRNGGKPDEASLPSDALTTYRITDEDAAGPFVTIPKDLEAQAKLPALGYTSLLEELGERFHASPALLKRLNPKATFAAGQEIQVPNVVQAAKPEPQQPRGRQGDTSAAAAVTVTVRKSTSDVTVTDEAGHVLFYAPVTTGSEHDPLPIGDWKVNGVQHDPKFHYNPDLFWDADPKQTKATIPAGPNNPVGVVWIDINHPHYGLHGTPEPSTIGKTTSHGCVRLTNWDATKLASLVRPGTHVVFAE